MTPLQTLGWGLLGAVGGVLVGQGSLVLETRLADDAGSEARGPSKIELLLLPVLGLLGFLAFAARQGMGAPLLIHSLWILILIQMLGFDLKHRLILDVVTLPALLLAIALASISPDLSVTQSLFGILVGGGALLPFAVISEIFHGGQGFGWGDVKLEMVVGAITGMSLSYSGLYALWALIAGVVIGGAVTILLLLTRRIGLKDALPYGPFLIAGAGLILYFMQ